MTASFGRRFAQGDPQTAEFLPQGFRDPAARAAAVAQAGPLHPKALAALRACDAALPPSPARRRGLDALAAGAPAVVTGQQVGLFGGPLYTLHKAAGAVAVAQAISAEIGAPVVPIFWLQTEDHDFDEIAAAQAPMDSGDPIIARLPSDPALARIPVGHRILGPEVEAALDRMVRAVGHLPHGEAALDQLRRHYQPGRLMADAFAGLVAEWFADAGLLILNPRRPEIAEAAADLHRRAVDEAGAIHGALAQRAEALEAAGYAVQISPRGDCALSFYGPEGHAGPRYRLGQPQGDAVPLAGRAESIDRATLARQLAEAPLRFSTSALLRPCLQDTLLPTVAYIAGPGELSYFGQLAPLYDLLGVTMPMLIPRFSAALVEPLVAEVAEAAAVAPGEIAGLDGGYEDILPKLARGRDLPGPSPEAVSAQIAEALAPALAALEADLTAVDPALARAVARTGQQCQRAAGKLARRVARSRLAHDPDLQRRAHALAGHLRPGGGPQERTHCALRVMAACGPQAVVQAALDAAAEAPFDPTPRVLTP